jgi:hypothetical protein
MMSAELLTADHWWLLPTSLCLYTIASMLGIDGAALFLPV